MKDCLVPIEKIRSMTYYGYGDKSDEEKLEKLLEEISKAIFSVAEKGNNKLYLQLPRINGYGFEEYTWRNAESYLEMIGYIVSFRGEFFNIWW